MINRTTREEVLKKLRRRYENAGQEHKSKLLDQGGDPSVTCAESGVRSADNHRAAGDV